MKKTENHQKFNDQNNNDYSDGYCKGYLASFNLTIMFLRSTLIKTSIIIFVKASLAFFKITNRTRTRP
jgi:hypothetical protein